MVAVVFVALLSFAGAVLLESAYITDADLRYPIVLLTEILGAIVALILLVRVAMAFVRGRVRATNARAEEGLKTIGGLLLVTVFSLIGLTFGVFLMAGGPGAIQLWPLGIVLIFGTLAAYGSSKLWGAWKEYRRLSGKSGNY